MQLKAVIVDDEELARSAIANLIAQNDEVISVGEYDDPACAIEAIVRDRPDLIFLDVQMPEIDGFGVLDAVRGEYLPAVIFTTAHQNHAVHAFEVGAVDYLLKPFSQGRFDEAVHRLKGAADPALRAEIRAAIQSFVGEVRGCEYPKRLLFKTDGRIVVVSSDEIEWVEAERDYVRIHLVNESFLTRETMTNMEAKLFPKMFVRIHRSTIVNTDHLAELRPMSNGEYAVKMRSGTELRLSRSHRENLPQIIPVFSFRKSEDPA